MKTYMKRLSAILLVLATVTLFVACGKGGSSSYTTGGGGGYGGGGGTGSDVSIKNFAFTSNNISVTKGTTVKWTNNDGVTHTVTADDGSFDSGSLTNGASFSHTFSTAGTYTYHCSIHTTMTGTVTVQ
jgi:plastocyanin